MCQLKKPVALQNTILYISSRMPFFGANILFWSTRLVIHRIIRRFLKIPPTSCMFAPPMSGRISQTRLDLFGSTGSSEPLQRGVKICRKTFDMCLIKSVCGRELFRIGCFTIFPWKNNIQDSTLSLVDCFTLFYYVSRRFCVT